jgi:hypothetical protein
MSRDVFVQDIPAEARTVADIPDDWMPQPLPFGDAAVVDAVRAVAPDANYSDPACGRIDRPGVAIEVSLEDASPLLCFALRVRTTDAEAADEIVRAILRRLDIRALDPEGSDGGIFT